MTEIVNFGGNVRFTPASCIEPTSEDELIALLRENEFRQIRVVGSRHSWSELIESHDVLVDMRRFNSISVREVDGKHFVTVGAGCQIKRVLHELNKRGLTLPAVGLITEQTIAGATATGTHGSGKSSLSHYLTSVRIACYRNGVSGIVDVNDGDDLRAARCSLGCMGIVVSVELPCVPQYQVLEFARPCASIDEALASESESTLQQFFLFPHQWRYCVQERRIVVQPRSWSAPAYRVYWFVALDIGLHVLVKLAASILKVRRFIHWIYQYILPISIFRWWRVVDRSDRMLVMEHELFRHLELEGFVAREHIRDAARFVEQVLRQADGALDAPAEEWIDRMDDVGLLDEFRELRGTFTHHYPVCFRRVLRDETMISMAAGDAEWWYSISFITYVEPRNDFYRLAQFLAKAFLRMFNGRIHWGKWFPLGTVDIEQMYPEVSRFRELCREYDPNGVFQNAFTDRILGERG